MRLLHWPTEPTSCQSCPAASTAGREILRSCSLSSTVSCVLVGDWRDNTIEWQSLSVLFSVCSFVHYRCLRRSRVSEVGIGAVVADPVRRCRSCHRWQSLGRRPFQIRRFGAIPRRRRCFSIPFLLPPPSHANSDLDCHFRTNRSISANSLFNLDSLW